MTYSPPVSKPDQLLVVDDLPDNSFFIQAILEEEGYQIGVEDNGKSALARIERTLLISFYWMS